MDKLKSRKLWVTVMGSALITLGRELGMNEETVQSLVAILAAYLVGQGIADHGKTVIIIAAGLLAISPVANAGTALTDPAPVNLTLPEIPETPDPNWIEKGSLWTFAWYDVSDQSNGTGVRVGYELTKNLRIRFDYLVEGFDFETNTITDDSEGTLSFRLDVFQGKGIYPYLIAGGGSASLSTFEWQYLIGAGVDYEIADLTLFVEFLHIRAEDRQSSDRNEIRAGVGMDFSAIGQLFAGRLPFRRSPDPVSIPTK